MFIVKIISNGVTRYLAGFNPETGEAIFDSAILMARSYTAQTAAIAQMNIQDDYDYLVMEKI